MSRINLIKIVIALAIATSLISLFIQAQAPDPNKHHRILSALNKMESMNSKIETLALKLRYRLQNNYDGLVSALNEIKYIQRELKTGDIAIYRRGNEKINRTIEQFDQALAQKEELLDRFKSYNAILKNSLYYFPHITEEIIHTDKLDKATQNNLRDLMHHVLMLHIGEKNSSNAEIYLVKIEASQHTPALNENINRLLQHAKYILKYENVIDQLINKITSDRSHELVGELKSAYEESFNHAFKIANYYYYFLVFTALTLFSYAAYSFSVCVKMPAT